MFQQHLCVGMDLGESELLIRARLVDESEQAMESHPIGLRE